MQPRMNNRHQYLRRYNTSNYYKPEDNSDMGDMGIYRGEDNYLGSDTAYAFRNNKNKKGFFSYSLLLL